MPTSTTAADYEQMAAQIDICRATIATALATLIHLREQLDNHQG